MAKHYLFYDIETTGINPCFDQIVQFAAIKTDTELNEVDRFEIELKLMRDVVPSPYASSTHQLALNKEGCSDYEAMARIHEWVNDSSTWSGGYNTLKFDDEFLRFGFFRNFFDPYSHQYAQGCGRFDLFPMMNIYYLFHRDIIKWPFKEESLSLKLEELNKVNGWVSGQAHHAMVDVEVTVALAKVLKSQEKTWKWLMGGFDKSIDSLAIERFANTGAMDHHQRLALWVDHRFGGDRSFMIPVLILGRHYRYRNQLIAIKLDDPAIFGKEIDQMDAYIMRRKLGEPGFLLPWTEHYLSVCTTEYMKRIETVPKLITQHTQWLGDLGEWFREKTYSTIENVDSTASLYQAGFWGPKERTWCEDWHAAPPKGKAGLLSSLSDGVFKQLAMRFLWRHYPEVLTQEEQACMEKYWQQLSASDKESLPVDYQNRLRMTPEEALNDIDVMLKQPDFSSKQKEVVLELRTYLMEQFELSTS
ncbi:MAG TPA: exonuclease domain-containing protein [Gammaproteobacteria bacterium]|nr:exonuclease domain-containing protein [Gammaproteobacteria bacterium]